MDQRTAVTPLLTTAQVQFLGYRVTVNVGSRSREQVPSLVRSVGCRVTPDRLRVTVFVPRVASTTLLDDINTSGVVAVVFSRPRTHQTLQLKGTDAVIEPPAPGDDRIITAARRAFIDELLELGYSQKFSHGINPDFSGDAVAITFTPVEAYDATPGPTAGRKLG